MTIKLYAQPYNIDAEGFYFSQADEFHDQQAKLRTRFGEPVEEFEIQFIDGDALDCALAQAIGLTQANFADYLTCAEAWQEWEKTATIIAIRECGYDFDPGNDPDEYGIDVYEVDSLRGLAEQFVEDGLFGEIPERLAFYLDFDAIARDLSFDYHETSIGDTRLIYRAA